MATTIINPSNPQANETSNNGIGLLIGIVLMIVLLFMFIAYILPAVQRGFGSSTPQINIPGKINIDINRSK